MKRHSVEEIRAKLRQAQELEHRGQSQGQICKTLGISVMTFHRWRKEAAQPQSDTSAVGEDNLAPGFPTQDQIEALRIENGRLRRIVTDLMLEKARLEEAASHRIGQKIYK